jgi:hypothetical protein
MGLPGAREQELLDVSGDLGIRLASLLEKTILAIYWRHRQQLEPLPYARSGYSRSSRAASSSGRAPDF